MMHPNEVSTVAEPLRHIGIGIDAGGTYTDAVVYDIAGRRLLGKSKALTTKWDYTLGIRQALGGLDPAQFSSVTLVALSTTLATNAIVEGDGQKVGMLIMPPYGRHEPGDIPHAPLAVVPGQLEITGEEIAPVDTDAARRAARRMVAREGVNAFAVSGFAGSVNPTHELAVRDAIREETGCLVVCGHELSDLLNFKTRAYTAMFNARLIPRLVRLIKDLESVLAAAGIDAPIVVVKGDGTLMSAAAAAERPVETVLSGPAASVSGARFLTGRNTALVVDMGGTTTDTAALDNGIVSISEAGSTVGGHRTHVKALAIRTTGLGGDSLIQRKLSEFVIGPRRVVPVSWTGAHCPGTETALAYVEQDPERFAAAALNMFQMLMLAGAPPAHLASTAQAVVALLRERPYTVAELIDATEAVYEGALGLEALEELGIIARSGPTPMDLLHVTGRFVQWDRATAERYLGLMARLTGQTMEDMVAALLETLTRRMSLELVKRQLDDEIDPAAIDSCPVCRALMANIFSGGSGYYAAAFHLRRPVIGIGAPVGHFLPGAASFLNAEVIIPDHADVANAIGAVTSQVVVSRRLRIAADGEHGFLIQGLPGIHRFPTIERADQFAREFLEKTVADEGMKAGTSAVAVTFTTKDRTLAADDGSDVFKSRIINACLAGPPDRVPAA